MGSTSTALGAGTSPVSALTAGVFLGAGISIVAMGRLLPYVYEMGQRSPAAGSRGKLSAHNTSNPISENSQFSTWCIWQLNFVGLIHITNLVELGRNLCVGSLLRKLFDGKWIRYELKCYVSLTNNQTCFHQALVSKFGVSANSCKFRLSSSPTNCWRCRTWGIFYS